MSVNIKQSNIFSAVECDGVGETGSESGLSSVKPVPEDVLHQQRLLLQTCDRLKLSVSRYTMLQQVWSLTQIYSVDFSQSRIGVNKCDFYKHTTKVCVSYYLGPPHLEQHT